jgi:hypothetical protein
MIRLAWRQFRTPAAVALAALIALAAVAAVTGTHLAHLYSTAMAACRPTGDCTDTITQFLRVDTGLDNAFGTLVAVVPGLIGVFWGAPLVAREIESGTFPLVWTQSVTRTRWLVVKLAVVGLGAVVAAGLLSLIVTWWARPLDTAAATAYATFGQRDIVPIGYAAFAFALGVVFGLLIRRTVPAMAVTLAAYVAVRIGGSYGLRPRLFGPAYRVLGLDPRSTGLGAEESPGIMLNSMFNGGKSSSLDPATPVMPNSWIYSVRVVDGSGHDLTDKVLRAECPDIWPGSEPPSAPGHVPAPQGARDAMQTCVAKIGGTYHELVTYQPAGRYWTLQWTEMAIYAVAALVIGAICIWRVRRMSA